jgi:hypothetical protein
MKWGVNVDKLYIVFLVVSIYVSVIDRSDFRYISLPSPLRTVRRGHLIHPLLLASPPQLFHTNVPNSPAPRPLSPRASPTSDSWRERAWYRSSEVDRVERASGRGEGEVAVRGTSRWDSAGWSGGGASVSGPMREDDGVDIDAPACMYTIANANLRMYHPVCVGYARGFSKRGCRYHHGGAV